MSHDLIDHLRHHGGALERAAADRIELLQREVIAQDRAIRRLLESTDRLRDEFLKMAQMTPMRPMIYDPSTFSPPLPIATD